MSWSGTFSSGFGANKLASSPPPPRFVPRAEPPVSPDFLEDDFFDAKGNPRTSELPVWVNKCQVCDNSRSLKHAHPMSAPLLKLALDWAGIWHSSQKRKYPNVSVPYMSHVAGVAAILSRHGFAEAVVAAGALHDVMEDCGVSHATLVDTFGAYVADLVRHVSEEDKSLSWEERKRLYLEHFSRKPWEAQAITLADKIDNFQSIVVCARTFGDPWAMFKRGKGAQVARFRDLLLRAQALPAHPLVDEYAATLAGVEADT